ncbi:MAG: transcription termination/antitermination factor NusG [Calditrichaeota bacterium]|nr:MAG: transcription termination/antitermination factor NusG [Calditrichota bacterium]
MNDAKWYALRIYSGQENKVRAYLDKEIEYQDMKDMIPNVMLPTEKIIEMKSGKQKHKEKMLYPGYIIIQMVLNEKAKHLVLNTPGILNFVGPQNAPIPLKPSEVEAIMGRIVEGAKEDKIVEVSFRVGDVVKVVDGPFNDFTGSVEEINEEKHKVKVLVSVFGRPTPIELDFLQVKLEK